MRTQQTRQPLLLVAICAFTFRMCGTDPQPLQLHDLTIPGLASDADTARVRAVFGEPQQVRDSTIEGEGIPLLVWVYSDVVFDFASGGEVFRTRFVGPSLATRRGLRVGDSVDRVRDLYGQAHDRSQDGRFMLYKPTPTPSRELAMLVIADAQTVKGIVLGHVITLD